MLYTHVIGKCILNYGIIRSICPLRSAALCLRSRASGGLSWYLENLVPFLGYLKEKGFDVKLNENQNI